jgi:TatD DNase family protein
MFTDTHAHLVFDDFAADLPAVIERAAAAGVTRLVSIGCDVASSRQTVALARRFANVFASVGLHPGYVPDVTMCDLKDIRALAGDPRVVAIGETGLDYYRGDQHRPAQRDLFWAQLDLANELRKPVIIHNRSAEADLREIIRAHAPRFQPWGVMHCFTGDAAWAAECIARGLLISFTGILTFHNAAALRELARQVALEHVMLETDAPYLAPVPHRGRRNEPAHLPAIAAVLAELKGVPVGEVARVTTANAARLFGWETDRGA